MIAAGFFLITDADRFPGVVSLNPTFGALAVLISVADGGTSAARLLSRPFPVLIGKLSYSLYLWHWPLIVIAREYAYLTDRSQQVWTLLGAAAGLVLSLIAYWAVEQRLRRARVGRHWRLQAIGTGFAVCAAACLILSLRHPLADQRNMFDRPSFYGSGSVGPGSGHLFGQALRRSVSSRADNSTRDVEHRRHRSPLGREHSARRGTRKFARHHVRKADRRHLQTSGTVGSIPFRG